MNGKTILTGIAAFSASVVITGTAMARPSEGDYRSRATGYWDQLATWERYTSGNWVNQDFGGGAVPNGANFVEIQASFPVTIRLSGGANAAADHLQVDGNLAIEGGRTLTLDGSGSATSSIASTKSITLAGSGAALEFVSNNQTLDGQGKVIGQHADATIRVAMHSTISTSRFLYNRAVIEGLLTIEAFDPGSAQGTATFVNKPSAANPSTTGILRADAGLLTMDPSVIFADESYVDGVTYLPAMEAKNGGELVIQGLGVSLVSLVGNIRFDSGTCSESIIWADDAEVVTTGQVLSGNGFLKTINDGAFVVDNEPYDGCEDFGDCDCTP